MMFLEDKLENNAVKTITKGFAITFSIALAYYVLTMAIPEIGGWYRVSNALRYLVLVMPQTAFAMALANFYVLFSQGKLIISWVYWLSPILNLGLGLGAYYVNSKWNPNHNAIKSIAIVMVYGLLFSVWLSVNKMIIAGTFFNYAPIELFYTFFTLNGVFFTLSCLSGYPLYKAYKSITEKK